jgi:cyanophycin synthetase
MKIIKLRVLSGPNYWSCYRKNLVAMLLDLEEIDQQPTNKIPGFYQRMRQLIPSLYSHRCSEGNPGGFFKRVEQGTWMGHVIEHIALEIQSLAGMEVGFGRTRESNTKGIYHVVFSYLDAEAGKYAANAAVNIAQALISNEAYDLDKDINALKDIWDTNRFGPSTGSIIEEAQRRKIPVIRLDDNSLVQLGYGCHQKRIEATIASCTSSIAVDIAGDKNTTKRLLESAEVPVPTGSKLNSEEELQDAINNIGFPVVVKPADGNQGKGATTNINSYSEALLAFAAAKKYSESIICEKYIPGDDYRALVINYKFVAAAMRKPAAVVGDGVHTIAELVELVNRDPRRGNGHENVMTRILIDDSTSQLLQKKGYTLQTVLPAGEECWLKTTANLSTGGTATDVTDSVHKKNILLFERIARTVGLDICGIDIMAPDLITPILQNGGAIIEVNAAPGFRMHLQPSEGKPRNVAAPVLDMLFKNNSPATIPIIAVTGTNGKTTTTRMIAHMCRQQGLVTGYTTTEGVYIQEDQIMAGDCSGPASARMVLKDPAVEMAVLECARGGILRSGLAFHECDAAVITNVAEDHLGLEDINTVQQLAKVKAVVAQSVKKDGYAILNADDDLVFAMRNELDCKVALFSLEDGNPRIRQHCDRGGVAAVVSAGEVLLINGKEKISVASVADVPITFGGKCDFNIANTLGAVLAAYVQQFPLATIREALRTFIPSPQLTPGRMNIFDFRSFTVLVDYAHNPHGMRAVGKYIQKVPALKRIGIIAGVGDRRKEDLVALGEEAARIFDEIIVRMDDDLRGRTMGEIFDLVSLGIFNIDQNKSVELIPDETDALQVAIHNACPECLIVVLTDKVVHATEVVQQLLELEQQQPKKKHKLSPLQKFPFLRNVAM